MISFMWNWANNPLALIAVIYLQFRCCRKGRTMFQKFIPVILYAAGMAACLVEGFLFAQNGGADAAIIVCEALAIHLVLAELMWPVHFLINAIQKRKRGESGDESDV